MEFFILGCLVVSIAVLYSIDQHKSNQYFSAIKNLKETPRPYVKADIFIHLVDGTIISAGKIHENADYTYSLKTKTASWISPSLTSAFIMLSKNYTTKGVKSDTGEYYAPSAIMKVSLENITSGEA